MDIIFLYLLYSVVVLENVCGAPSPRTLSPEKSGSFRLQGHVCRLGQFAEMDADGKTICRPCPENHFMDEDKHSYSHCNPCTQIEEHIISEVLVKNCTSDSDAVIDCAEGYFRDWNKQCKRCTQCELGRWKHEVAPCRSDRDTVCCPGAGMRAVWSPDEDSFDCVKDLRNTTLDCEGSIHRASGCRAGEYLVSGCLNHNGWSPCKPCEDGTFMNISRHNMTSCIPCSPPRGGDSYVVSHCNSTHDNVYDKHPPPQDDDLSTIAIIIVIFVVSVCCTVIVIVYMYRKRRDRKQRVETESDSSDESQL